MAKVAQRASVELLKMKALSHIVDRYPRYAEDLKVFLTPHVWHEKHPPQGQPTEPASLDSGTELLMLSSFLPSVPIFAETSKTGIWRLCADIMMLTGYHYQAFANVARSTGMIRDCSMLQSALASYDADYIKDTSPYQMKRVSVQGTCDSGTMASTDLPGLEMEEIMRLEQEYSEQKHKQMQLAARRHMEDSGWMEPCIWSADKLEMEKNMESSPFMRSKQVGTGQGALYFYDMKQMSKKIPARKGSRMTMLIEIHRDRFQFWLESVYMRFAGAEDLGMVMVGRGEVAFHRVLKMLTALMPKLHIRVQNWLYSEESLRASGLMRAKYMCGLVPREYSIFFSKVPILRPICTGDMCNCARFLHLGHVCCSALTSVCGVEGTHGGVDGMQSFCHVRSESRPARVDPEPRQYLGLGNSTAYPEVTGTPVPPTKELLRVPRQIREEIMKDLGQGDAEFETHAVGDDTSLDLTAETEGDDGADAVLFWHANHALVYRELLHQLRNKYHICLDFTPGDGVFGLQCIEAGHKYWCFPVNESHCTVLLSIWEQWCIQNKVSKDPHPFVQSVCVSAVTGWIHVREWGGAGHPRDGKGLIVPRARPLLSLTSRTKL